MVKIDFLEEILYKDNLTKEDLIYLMKLKKSEDLERLYKRAYEIKEPYLLS